RVAHREGDDEVAIDLGNRMREDDKPAVRPACVHCDRLLDFRSVMDMSGSRSDAEPLGGRLSLAPKCEMSGSFRMHENGNPVDRRRDILQYLHPLAAHLRFEIDKPGNVAARPRHVMDEAAADWIGDHDEYDGGMAGKGSQLRQCRVAVTEDDIGRQGE